MMVVSVQCVGEWDGPNVGIAVVRDDDGEWYLEGG
jgi:hypothetical protein